METVQRSSTSRTQPGTATHTERTARSLALFFGLAYACSWLLWLPLVADAFDWVDGPVSPYWHFAGGIGPMLAAIAVRTWTVGPIPLRSIPHRLLGKPARRRWLLWGALGPVALFVVATLAIGAVRGEWPDLSLFGESTEFPHLPLPVYWLANLVFYGFGEEVGWRGFALPRLSTRYGALMASSVLSLFWAGWHLPLFAFADGLSTMNPAEIVGWYMSLWVGSILLTWLYRSSNASLLTVALFHASLDICINSPVDDALQTVMGALVTFAGLGTLVALKREQKRGADEPRAESPRGRLLRRGVR